MLNNFGMNSVSQIEKVQSRSISPENFTGEKGKGGMATTGTGEPYARDLGIGWKISPSIEIQPGETAVIADISGMGMIKHIWMTDNNKHNRSLILRMYWDGSDKPSVEVPACDFFASGDYQTFGQISSLPVCVNPRRGFNCYWDMPFRKSAKITIENVSPDHTVLYYQVDYQLMEIPENCGYFHAQFRRVNPLPYKEVFTILDGVKGNGKYVGTYMFWGVNNNGWWGEGEIKFYLDGDKDFPTICGTGTEDYFCGSWNFDVGGKYVEYSNPYCGLSKVLRPNGTYTSQQRFSMYRWHLCDPIYFNEDIKVTIQALGWRTGGYLALKDDISAVSYWYQDSIFTDFPTFPTWEDLEII